VGGGQKNYKTPDRLTGYPIAEIEKAWLKQKHSKLSKK